MSTTKEILEGDTNRFAFKVAFQRDPDHGASATVEESLSWGGFQIWVEGQNLCLHLEGGVTVEAVHWYLLPVLEWLSACWDYLLHEERLPLQNVGDDAWRSLQSSASPPPALPDEEADSWEEQWQHWWLRHSLLACRQGGLFPEVVFRRWRDREEISWGPRRLAGQPEFYRFLAGSGFARLAPAEVAVPLYKVLRQAVDYLVAQAPDSARLKRLLQGVESLRVVRTDHRLALMAGLGATPDEQEDHWRQVREQFRNAPPPAAAAALGVEETDLFIPGSCQAALLFGSVAPTVQAADVLTLAGKLIDLYSPQGDPPTLRELTREETLEDSGKRPWDQGYNLARDVLEELSLPETERDWIDILAVYDRLQIHLEEVSLSDQGIRAVSIAGPQHRPSVLLNPLHATNAYLPGRRFTLAHELCHQLFDRGYGARLAIASGPWAPRDVEQRANAFAAFLLMPPALIRRLDRRLDVPLASVEGVRSLARQLRTSFTATLEHLGNLNFLSEEDHSRIQLEADEQSSSLQARIADLRVLAKQIELISGITIEANANDEGHLTGEVGALEIAKGLRSKGLLVEPEMVKLEGGPIRKLASYAVKLALGYNIETEVKVAVIKAPDWQPTDPERLAQGLQLAREGKTVKADEARLRFRRPQG